MAQSCETVLNSLPSARWIQAHGERHVQGIAPAGSDEESTKDQDDAEEKDISDNEHEEGTACGAEQPEDGTSESASEYINQYETPACLSRFPQQRASEYSGSLLGIFKC